MQSFLNILYKCVECALLRLRMAGSSAWIRLLFYFNGAHVGCSLTAIGVPSIHVSMGGEVVIGSRFTIRTGVRNTEVGGGGSRLRVGPRGTLRIGAHVGMSNATIVCDESVTIGDDVLIGGGVQIFDTNFHCLDADIRCSGGERRDNVRTAPITIGNRVFIGANAMICKGVSIGDEAIVAAGSVVVRDIPAGEVWGGNPARRIK